jgi:diguanylate cyclase (GGDEF)-like protein
VSRHSGAHEEELLLLRDITASLSLAMQYLQKEDTVQFLAYFDPLTGLAKRSLFCERLDRMMKGRVGPEGAPIIIAFDVAHLSNVNDSFGHHVGDLLLQRVAERLRYHMQNDEQIGYLGSGTFVLLTTLMGTTEDGVSGLLGSAVFNDVFELEGRSIRISFKSGIAHAPEDGEDGDTLVQKAEAALKYAKESGEQSLQYQVRSEVAERLALEHKMRIALDEEQFLLYYQPKLDIATERISSVEALIRWKDPEKGIIPPGLFLPLLESSGMIVAVGEWVLRRAAQDCVRWKSLRLGPIRVAVNVSALQLRRRAFVEQVLSKLGDWASNGYGIDLEITESGFLQDLEGTSRKLRELRDAGVKIALDDFGTGYSALGLLSQLPVDTLKIDRSFISGLPDDQACATLVSSVIGLATAFKLTTVAEGVETQEQYDVLRRLKCHQSQGYLHGRPVPAEQLEELLWKRRSSQPLDA